MTILRRVGAILEQHREQIAGPIAGVNSEMREASHVHRATGLRFYNTSKFTLTGRLQDPDGLQANIVEYVHSSSSAIDMFDRFEFDEVVGCASRSVPSRPCRSWALASDHKRRDGNL